VGDNGRRYTITLRKGVRFHNGKEMTSADVVPSLQHWAKLGTTPKAIWKNVEGLEAKDPYTVVIYLKEPSGSLLFALGSPNNGGAIYPKEVVAAAGDGQVKEYIGTHRMAFREHGDGALVLVVGVEGLVYVPGYLLGDDGSGRMQIEGGRLADEPGLEHAARAWLILGGGPGRGGEDQQREQCRGASEHEALLRAV